MFWRAANLRVVLLILIGGAFVAAFSKAARFPDPSSFKRPEIAVSKKQEVRFESHFASSKPFVQVHAASIVELRDGRLRAFWFSGSREGAKDVAIHSAIYDPVKSVWGEEVVSVTREQTQHALHRYIAKLGNPVVMRAADGSLRMFYVAVSLGGWAGSSISTMSSYDEGATWEVPRRLITSPFINISTLVKGPPFFYEDGTVGLPIYHEFISKFGELLRLDRYGNVLDKQRLAAGGEGTLQPVVLIQSGHKATTLMRYSGNGEPKRVVVVDTEDVGKHWSLSKKSVLRNPDAAVAAVCLPDGRMLVVLNDQEHGREALSLMLSLDGGVTWHEVQKLEDQLANSSQANLADFERNARNLILQSDPTKVAQLEAYLDSTKRAACKATSCRYEFSYPYLIQTQVGDFHLVYTWNRTLIKHMSFSKAWLDQKAEELTQHVLH